MENTLTPLLVAPPRKRGRPPKPQHVDPQALLERELVETLEQGRKLRKQMDEQGRYIVAALGDSATAKQRIEAMGQLADAYAKLTKAVEGVVKSIGALRKATPDDDGSEGFSLEDLLTKGS